MKGYQRLIIFAFITQLGAATAFADGFWGAIGDWFKKCDFNVVYLVTPLQLPTDPNTYGNLSFYDGYGDRYSFGAVSNNMTAPKESITMDLFLYGFKTEPINTRLYFAVYAAPNDTLIYGLAGCKARISYGRLSAEATAGITTIGIVEDVGVLQAAFPGDPGAYLNGQFIPPGTKLSASATAQQVNFGFDIALRYNFLKWAYISAGYLFIPSSMIDTVKYSLGTQAINSPAVFKPIVINALQSLTLGIGIGLE
jgi:hypothetical protein